MNKLKDFLFDQQHGEFIRIIKELKEQEKKEDERQDMEYRMMVSALRLHAEAQHELSKQIVRLNRATTVLALTQISLVAISIVVAIVLNTR